MPGTVVEIELRWPGERAVFRAPRTALSEYLTRTQEIVAFGAEHQWLDLDHAVEMLRVAPPGCTRQRGPAGPPSA